MDFKTVKCDVCGCQKAETNHWLVAMTRPEWTWISITPAETTVEPGPQYTCEDICGQACALKRMAAWLDSWMAPQPELGDRASTLILNPPLTRDGHAPAATPESVTE